MSDTQPILPAIPPTLASNESARPDTADQVPIPNFIAAVEAILRQPRRVWLQLHRDNSGPLIGALLAVALACALVYGVVVGAFSGGDQFWAAPVKIAGGLLLSALICLPSLYIFSCLSGSTARLVEVLGLIAGLLALMTVLLVGFAPVAWVFSQSTTSLPAMGALHLAFWFVATGFGLRFLYAGFQHLQVRSKAGLHLWIILFLLVALQMSTALRPILGTAPTFLPGAQEKKFFLSHWSDCLNK